MESEVDFEGNYEAYDEEVAEGKRRDEIVGDGFAEQGGLEEGETDEDVADDSEDEDQCPEYNISDVPKQYSNG